MKVVTAKEMQHIDKITIDKIGIPGEVLMGFAGKSIADFIMTNLSDRKRIAIFCGTGNNGGDGFVIAYFLANNGFIIDVYIAGKKERVSETSRLYLNVCLNLGINICEVTDVKKIDHNEYDLIIDAMLGTGFTGIARGIVKDAIITINKASTQVLSVDLPSGLPSDGEAPEGVVVKADFTVTIGLPKISLVTYPGKFYSGKLFVQDIGFPVSLTDSEDLKCEIITHDFVKQKLKINEKSDTHKGEVGHLLMIGGFDSMEGAIILSAKSAFETGTGLCTLLTTKEARSIIAGKIPELITRSFDSLNLSDQNHNNIKCDLETEIHHFFNEGKKYDAVIIGPGMGRTTVSSSVFDVVLNCIRDSGIKRVLIDGDGLFFLSEYLKYNKLPDETFFVITPHFQEASRLLNRSVEAIKQNRIESAIELSKKTNAIALLKGPSTIVTNGEQALINTTGNPGLATAGSGDVLSGIIGSLLLLDISPMYAAGIGAFIHGLAADICQKERRVPILKATDVIGQIRKAMSELQFQ